MKIRLLIIALLTLKCIASNLKASDESEDNDDVFRIITGNLNNSDKNKLLKDENKLVNINSYSGDKGVRSILNNRRLIKEKVKKLLLHKIPRIILDFLNLLKFIREMGKLKKNHLI